MIYTVYVLYSVEYKSIYIGYTSNLIERMKSHNILGNKNWTSRYRPWVVVYCKAFTTKKEALAYEKLLKGGKGREWIWNKIAHEFPAFGFISA